MESSQNKPNLLKFFGGIILGIFTIVIGYLLVIMLPWPNWLGIGIVVIGIVELLIWLVDVPKVIKYLSSKQKDNA